MGGPLEPLDYGGPWGVPGYGYGGGGGRWVEDDRTYEDRRRIVADAVQRRFGNDLERVWVYVADLTDEWAVFVVDGGSTAGTYRIGYTLGDNGVCTLADTPEKVVAQTTYQSVEAVDHIAGRVLEAKQNAADGGRVFRVQIIAYGDSKNRRHYSEAVMRRAAPLYEGARAFDHHRTDAEYQTSTIAGMVGHYRNVEATSEGIQADLVLFPSAKHVAEALDASITAQASGLRALVGLSHDVMAMYQPLHDRAGWYEATEIASVNSADVVTDPAAGGRVTRMVAGGSGNLEPPQEGTVNLKQLIALLRTADPAKRVELLKEHAALLTAAGVDAGDLGYQDNGEPIAATGGDTGASSAGAGDAGTTTPEPAAAGAGATEAVRHERESLMGGQLITAALNRAGVDQRLHQQFVATLPTTFTEAELVERANGAAAFARGIEASGLTPKVPGGATVTVTQEDTAKKVARLDAMFEGDFRTGYHSLKEAYADIVGLQGLDLISAELPFWILRESCEFQREGSRRSIESQRSTESLTTSSWGEILGDSITRRMLKMYNVPSLQAWQALVNVVPVNDFRTQRRIRMGGYGTLPVVNEGAPYQPLTSPADEEATYAIEKKGGTEDLTIETIANDDLGAVRQIPQRLGRAAAQTLYRFVFDFLANNPTVYDSVALFHASHSNTTAAALSQSALEAAEAAMMTQVAYGDSSEVLNLRPKFIVVPAGLHHTAFKLVNSAVAIPSSVGASDVPNSFAGQLTQITIPYYSDTNDWFLVADPLDVPTIELGFFNGRQDPELFVQDDPRVGAVFTADKITYKIRHIYKGAVLDYRGFYRNTQ